VTAQPRRVVRVAVIDSGIAAGHPHVGGVSGGIALVGEDPAAWQDRLGHGTAVAGAIRDLAPDVELVAVRVFDTTLATTARLLCQAIDWASESGVDLINLSVGTTNEAHRGMFSEAVARARGRGAWVVSAAMDRTVRLLPGTLDGVVGVVADSACPRGELRRVVGTHGVEIGASPRPRPIPGVPVDRNLAGVSFAVANATGVLAGVLGAGAPVDLESWLLGGGLR
jgi:hypothetical protein